jgi:hypothetical protein
MLFLLLVLVYFTLFILKNLFSWVHNFPLGLYRSIISTNNDGNWREKALAFGRRQRCSFLLIMDTDAYLFRDTLRHLISLDKIVVSPLLYSPFETYTNAEDLKLSGDFTRRKTLNFIRVLYLIRLIHSNIVPTCLGLLLQRSFTHQP